ncbi:DNA polymerase Y family protein [Streptomyces sp. TR06-5]|uniref:DNA polymerase Y family protein n=1 Tax=Streptomyces sp. TR06-5 TaxID=3385976 RepID=UPI0039A0A6E2
MTRDDRPAQQHRADAHRPAGRAADRAGELHEEERAEQPHVLYVHFSEVRGRYAELLDLLGDITPVVQAVPPDAALADVRGALRYFRQDAAALATLLRTRALARYGSDCTVGVAVNPLLARMAAQDGPEGGVRCIPGGPRDTAAFLEHRPVGALHGVGPATARTLCAYGLDTVDRVAAARPATLQRILGAAAARRLQEQARGIDPAPVVADTPSRSMSRDHSFGRDELDADVRRRALLGLADRIGFRMRAEGQVAAVVTLTVRCADRSTLTRSRRLPEPTAHTPALAAAAHALHDALGLQRARVRSVALRAEELTAAELAAHQLSLDPQEEKARQAEAAADRARRRFGPGAVHPAGGLDAA